MTLRRLTRSLAIVLVAVATCIGVLPATSGAAGPQAVGWWSRAIPLTGDVEGQSSTRAVPYTPGQELPTDPTLPIDPADPGGSPIPTVPLPIPPPTIPEVPITTPPDLDPGIPNPTVPDGGLWVANDSAGAVAVSALRYRGDVGSANLTLHFAPGSTTIGPMIACPALSQFSPGPGGTWADRPAHDCDRISLGGVASPDGKSLEFNIPQGFLPFGERVLDIVILPDTGSGDVFSVYFEPPDEDSLVVNQGQELPQPVAELPEIDPFTLPEPLAPFDSGESFDSPTFTSGGTATISTDDAVDDETASAAPEPIAQILEPFIESRTGRIIAIITLLLMGGALWYFGGTPIRQPRLLGALAGDTPAIVDQPTDAGRGIGRFRRDRTAPPPRL